MSAAKVGALACFSAAAVWPAVMGWVTDAMLSPYERALRDAWCGVATHDASMFLGHCAACWSGSAILIAAGAMLLSSAHRTRPRLS